DRLASMRKFAGVSRDCLFHTQFTSGLRTVPSLSSRPVDAVLVLSSPSAKFEAATSIGWEMFVQRAGSRVAAARPWAYGGLSIRIRSNGQPMVTMEWTCWTDAGRSTAG